MAAGNVMHAAVVAFACVESDPAGEMRHGLGARPVGIILMPSNDAAVLRRLAKQLIVPKANGAIEQLTRSSCECRMPENIVKTRANAPRSEGMKEDRVRLSRFVSVVFVPQLVAGMRGIKKLD